MTAAKTTKGSFPLACQAILSGTYRVDLLTVSPLAKTTFVVYRGKLIIFQGPTAGDCLAFLEEYVITQKIG